MLKIILIDFIRIILLLQMGELLAAQTLNNCLKMS